jgi:protein O-GlcNAc transferase
MAAAPRAVDRSSLLDMARRCAADKRWDEAARLYHELLARSECDVEALEGLGLLALQAEHRTEALDWLQRASRCAPDDARVLAYLGIAQRQNGLSSEAITSYRRALALDPQHGTWINLARAERAAGHMEQAIDAFRQALELKRDSPEGWSMLSNVLREAGRTGEALEAARQALAQNPWLGDAHLNEGVALHAGGQLDLALGSYWAASTVATSRPAALANLRVALADPRLAAKPPPELASVRRLLEAPNDVPALLKLAQAARRAERPALAALALERVASVAPTSGILLELGMLSFELGQVEHSRERLLSAFGCADAGLDSYRRFARWVITKPLFRVGSPAWHAILERCPDDEFSLVNLGVTLQRQCFPTLAAKLAERALALRPRSVEAHVNLGSALSDQGRFDEAHAVYRRLLEFEPTCLGAVSNQLFCLHFDPNVSAETVRAEHVAFGRRFADPLGRAPRGFERSRDPERRLRIGYVSPDLRRHPVAYFLEPVLGAHDQQAFEVYCYSDVERPDDTTARLAGLAGRFVEVSAWSDAQLAERIAADEIDLLVDLAGHTAKHRLLAFARKPSPIQVSWLGYFDTTGVTAIDYRIADAASVPLGAEWQFVERVVRLPRTSNCFLHPPAPAPAAPPCRTRGHVTFGCFNNPAKVTRQVVETFARILHGVPGSRLLLAYGGYDDPGLKARYLRWFADQGIAAERLELAGHASLGRFLSSLAQVDIALDPFPYSGETTAVHTLWMGVPLVALEGSTLVQRLASRVLRVVGLDDWVAATREQYVELAQSLSRDPARLVEWRGALRERLQASPLFDHRGVTRELETAYRAMWRAWCSGRTLA